MILIYLSILTTFILISGYDNKLMNKISTNSLNHTKRWLKLQSHLFSSSTGPKAINYNNESTRFLQYFKENNSELDSSIEYITIIPKSNFSDWKSNISNKTIEIAELTNQSIKKFPGNKLIQLIDEDNESKVITNNILFINDDKNNKITFKSFDSIWSTIYTKNKTYSFINYNKDEEINELLATSLSISWGLFTYKFNYHKTIGITNYNTSIIWPKNTAINQVKSLVKAYTIMKDLTDTPALSLGPNELEIAVREILTTVGVNQISSIIGIEELVNHNFPQIAAVGMAAADGREPRVIEANWKHNDNDSLPEIVIIGKGVMFDTGGLNIKSGGGMKTMKRDMAGAAQALALSLLIIENNLPVKLKLIIPSVENSISGIALRPGDVIRSRNNKTTEITNTDAEGRLILADALSLAVEGSPNLIVDFATLTGAARVALGNDLPALFSNNQEAMLKLWNISNEIADPVWPMPLYEPLRTAIKSNIADFINAAEVGGGAITAALYLSEYIKKPSATSDNESSDNSTSVTKEDSYVWFHLDFQGSKSGVADPQGLRAVYEYIRQLYNNN